MPCEGYRRIMCPSGKKVTLIKAGIFILTNKNNVKTSMSPQC